MRQERFFGVLFVEVVNLVAVFDVYVAGLIADVKTNFGGLSQGVADFFLNRWPMQIVVMIADVEVYAVGGFF